MLQFPLFKEVVGEKETVVGWEEAVGMDYGDFQKQGDELVKKIIQSIKG